MRRWSVEPWRRGSSLLLALGVCVSIAILTWFGYRAIREWQHSSTQLAARRADETADLLVTALTRDMRGAQESVLSSQHWDEFMLDPPHDVSNLVASAFARYPYPELFFGWRGAPTADRVLFFTRSNREPAWISAGGGASRFPVDVHRQPEVAAQLLSRISRDIAAGGRLSTFEVVLHGEPYQVVARLLYRDQFREQVEGVFGFVVNLAWIRSHYFPELTAQVARIGSPGTSLDVAVLNESHELVTSTQRAGLKGPISQRSFPLMFFDPRFVALDPPSDLPRRTWAVQVAVASDSTLAAAIRGADRTLIVAALAAVALAVGLVLTGRAQQAHARLAEMRSEFVSTVTHELKTPIATIRAAGDTLASGRISSADTSREYAQMVVQEAKRLTRLVDNLLAYARITDVADVYSFEPLSIDEAITAAVDRFSVALHGGDFELHVEVPPDPPFVRADRLALELLLDNLIDNAIRYSKDRHWLRIYATAHERFVRIDITDHGVGIAEDEIARVTRRFVRGRRAGSGGSGLGLAIATRIARDHGGTLSIASALDSGTTVSINLPMAARDDEETHTGD